MVAKIRPLAFLIGRVAVGAVFAVHGWQKWNDWGIEGTSASFQDMGVPSPELSAYFAATVELVGGVLLILGALLPVAGTLLAANMIGALVTVHWANGFWVEAFGYEFVLTLAAASIVIGFSGGGALAVDKLFGRQGKKNATEPAAEQPA